MSSKHNNRHRSPSRERGDPRPGPRESASRVLDTRVENPARPRYIPGSAIEPQQRNAIFPREDDDDLSSSPTERNYEPVSATRSHSRLLSFAQSVDLNDYEGCREFIRKNPELRDDNDFEKANLAAAIDALAAGDADSRRFAFSCMEKCLILKKNRERSAREPSFLADLIKKKQAALDEFKKSFKALKDYCQSEAGKRTPSIPPDRAAREATPAQSGLSLPTASPPALVRGNKAYYEGNVAIRSGSGRHDKVPEPRARRESQGGQGTAGPRHSAIVSQGQLPQTAATNRHQAEARAPNSRAGVWSHNSSIKIDDLQPVTPPQWDRYFTHGTVFGTYLHTQDTASSVRTEILSRFYRLVVVGRGNGYCWAICINTYGGQGLAKPGLKDPNIRAHAIAYTRGHEYGWLHGEPRSPKREIEVVPINNSRIAVLHPASRLNFEKVLTVELNQPIVKIGKVSEASMRYFKSYWLNELELKRQEW